MNDIFSVFNLRKLSPFERLLFVFLLAMLFASSYALLYKLSLKHSSVRPVLSGSLNEGVIGNAKFINPVLALSQSDKDLSKLIFSGLMRPGPNGLEPDLVEKYEISDDGKEYIFHIKKGVLFHDGEELTSNDIVFTVKLIQNPEIKSLLYPNWVGVQVVATDKYTVKFILPKAYSGFLENTTVGILPAHIFARLSANEIQFSPYNEKPIGSGPYKLAETEKDEQGIPRKYHLVANEYFYLGKPKLEEINIYCYANEKDRFVDWQNGALNAIPAVSANYVDEFVSPNLRADTFDYPRVFAVFINKNKNSVLKNKKVRQALDLAINKKRLVDEVLKGYAYPIDGPLPHFVFKNKYEPMSDKEREKEINSIMESLKWQKNDDGFWEKDGEELVLELSLANTDELRQVANFIQDEFKRFGFKLFFKKYDLASFTQKAIRERDYELLLFGQSLGRNVDLYPFWHSSQQFDPGLNITKYSNKKLDTVLVKLRAENDTAKRSELLAEASKLIANDYPALFLYSPQFIYIRPKDLHGSDIKLIGNPQERFSDAYKWFIKNERIWNIFKSL